MKVETKFNVGDSVVFIHDNVLVRKDISRIEITATQQDGKASILTVYYFPAQDKHRQLCRYEQEIASSKEELIANMVVDDR